MSQPTPDFPDWSLPSRNINVDVDITPAPGTIGSGANLGPMDVSQYESVLINFRPPVGAGGDRFLMRASWGGVFSAGRDEYLYFHDASAYSPSQRVIGWDLPCKGSQLTLSVTSANVNTFQCSVIGTSRKYRRNEVSLQGIVSAALGSGTGRLLGTIPSTVLAANGGTAGPLFIPPVAEKVLIHTNQNTPLIAINVAGLVTQLAALAAPRLTIIRGGDVGNGSVPVYVSQTGLEITVTNSDTVTHSTNVTVWDAS